MLLYSFGVVGECLFQLDIAANPADRFYFDIIINGGGLDGIARAWPEPHPYAGQLTVGVLVAQDIAVVPMLVFAQSGIDVLQQWPLLLVRVVIALVILAALLVWIGKTARQRLPMATLLEGNVELAILFSLGICFLAASLTGYIGLSPVFGAFCAGLALAHTNLRKAVLDVIQPVQSLLLVVFFVSIGLLVDLEYVKSHWGMIVGVTFGVLFIKTLLGWALLTIGSGTGACVIACYPTNRRIQLCFDNKRGRIGNFYKF